MNSSDLSIKSYTDLHALNKLKQADHKDDPNALRVVAEQFESLFLNMLLKNMRQANEALTDGGLFNSSESKFYQDMMDQQLSMSLASEQGIGLSEVLVRQLAPLQGQAQFDPDKASMLNPQAPAPTNSMTQLLEQTTELAVQASIKRADQQLQTSASDSVAALPDRFETPEQFVAQLMPLARKVTANSEIPAEALVAQAALETGWGKHLPRREEGGNSFNLFGIKADERWSGERVASATLEYRNGAAQEEQASFRAYPSYEASMKDYLSFVQDSPRYQTALEQAGDARSYIEQLHLAGYATDPAYSSKIIGILDSDLLQRASKTVMGS